MDPYTNEAISEGVQIKWKPGKVCMCDVCCVFLCVPTCMYTCVHTIIMSAYIYTSYIAGKLILWVVPTVHNICKCVLSDSVVYIIIYNIIV